MSRNKEDMNARRALPARDNRGIRIRSLLGKEIEADESFWGQDAWREDADDEDYMTEAEDEDVIDSDFDEQEEPDSDVHDEDADEKKSEGRSRVVRRDTTLYSSYSKQALAKKKQKNDAQSRSAEPDTVISAVEEKIGSTRPEISIPLRKSSRIPSYTEDTIASDEDYVDDVAVKRVKRTARFTQEQLLEEAVRTEVDNAYSLDRLEQIEIEKKLDTLPSRVPCKRDFVRYHSKKGMSKTITFMNTSKYPDVFNQTKPRARSCVEGRTRYFNGRDSKEVAVPIAAENVMRQ